jgi:hypothetical protein
MQDLTLAKIVHDFGYLLLTRLSCLACCLTAVWALA